MKRSLILFAVGAFSLMPIGLQPASAHDYYDRDDRIERHVDRDRAALRHDYAERHYYGAREREAAREGDYRGAWWFSRLRHREDREIAARRADLHRDHERLERYGY